uniref:Cytochrome c6 n=1 Tax=Asparagopsis taxiformis TaxID=260499 RepID=A0A1C9CC86_9FLOR|nr:cytochrome c553 [Asparagopsis taxiformis]AOM66003.1 cytochrome c553 [Asparagopsis taxiformis]
MKVLFIVLMMCCSIFGLGNTQATFAADLELGEQIFTANCAACHAGGNNLIMPEKTLQKEVLEKNGMNTVTAITNQVTNGKNAMPAFNGRLAEEEIDNVANYVLDKCEQGW